MSDDPSSKGAPAPAPALDAEPRPDYNSRVETRLWLLRKDDERAEARMRVKFARREFRLYVNGELLWSRNYDVDDLAQFDAHAAAKHDEYVALGWASA
jgi:hypothetical protein